jgi:hypothetical protein
MMPPLPSLAGESEHARFKRFAKAILAVPKAEIPTAEEAITRLKAKRQKIESKLAAVRREVAKRKLRENFK